MDYTLYDDKIVELFSKYKNSPFDIGNIKAQSGIFKAFMLKQDLCFSDEAMLLWLDDVYANSTDQEFKAARVFLVKLANTFNQNLVTINKILGKGKFPEWSEHCINDYLANRLVIYYTKNRQMKERINLLLLFAFFDENDVNSFEDINKLVINKFSEYAKSNGFDKNLTELQRFICYCVIKDLIKIDCYIEMLKPNSYMQQFFIKASKTEDRKILYEQLELTNMIYVKEYRECLKNKLDEKSLLVLKKILKEEDNPHDYQGIFALLMFLDKRDLSLNELKPSLILEFNQIYSPFNAGTTVVLKTFLNRLAARGLTDRISSAVYNELVSFKIAPLTDDYKDKRFTDDGFAPELLLDIMDEVCMVLTRFKYSETSLYKARRALYLFLVFLREHELRLSPELAKIWTKNNKDISMTTTAVLIAVKILKREEITSEDIRDIQQANHRKPKELFPENFQIWFDKYIEWCTLTRLITDRTARIYYYALAPFIKFIINCECKSFEDLTPEVLRKFNLLDLNIAAHTRASYNGIIKNFLFYLATKNVVSFKFLFIINTKISSPPRKPVKVLTEEQKALVSVWCSIEDDSLIHLRNVLFILIAAELALRNSDILNLKFSDFDFETMQLTIIQQKTKNGIKLPISETIVKAMVKYVKAVGEDWNSPYVFLRANAPVINLKSFNLWNALKKFAEVSGLEKFTAHDLRRTKASVMCQSDAPVDLIALALGHSNEDTLDHYVVTDEKKMRKCPLPLKGEHSLEYKGSLI